MGYNGYSYQYGFDIADNAIAGVGGFFAVFMVLTYLITMALSIATYVMSSLGIYTIANRRGIHHAWLAWLPVGNVWVLGSISDQYQYIAKGKTRNRRKVLLGLNIGLAAAGVLLFVLAFATGISMGFATDTAGAMVGASLAGLLLFYVAFIAIALVQAVFVYIALYDLYQSCDPANALTYFLLSIFISVTMPFFLFFCRKKDQGMPPRRQPAPAPVYTYAPPVYAPAPQPTWTPVEPAAAPMTAQSAPVENTMDPEATVYIPNGETPAQDQTTTE